MEIYQVGGSLRDRKLGLPIEDRDWVVVGATADEMERLGYQCVGKDFPVFLHPTTHEEYALARTERKTAPGYKGFQVYAAPDVSLYDDLKRRDLTINAMAESADGTLIDPFGGAEDIHKRLLRHVSPAFVEDPVRILRVARIGARLARFNFRVCEETNALMSQMVEAGEVNALVPERVQQELLRALAVERPSRFFELLRDCGALARLFPELDRLFGVPQAQQHHPEIDTGVHTLLVVDQAAQLSHDPCVVFAALLHDVGKGETPPALWPHHVGHERRSAGLINALCDRLRIPKAYRDLALLVARYHSRCHRAAELRPATLLDTLQALDALRRPQRFEQFLLACAADSHGRGGRKDQTYPQADLVREALMAARSVDAGAVAATGLSGEALTKAIRSQRIQAIRRQLREGPPSPSSPGSPSP